tara:strand:+ start:1148 stop:1696 length:549 start_codon:yes stop_codon:yes gene_type:complete
MAKAEDFLDAPVPGQSLTAAPKSRPWRRPADSVSIDEAVGIYTPIFSNKTTSRMMLGQIGSGIALTSIADLLITANTMEGKHSLDVGLMIAPVLVETMITMAEIAGVDYVVGNEPNDDAPGTKKDVIDQVMKQLQEEGAVGEIAPEEADEPMTGEGPSESMEQPEPESEPPPSGLMAPRRPV